MSAPRTLFNGFTILVAGIALSLMLMATVGQIGDRSITILSEIGIFAVNDDWAESIESVYTFQSILFFLCALPAISGITIFILSAVRRQRYDVQEQPQIDYTSEYTPDYTAEFGGPR